MADLFLPQPHRLSDGASSSSSSLSSPPSATKRAFGGFDTMSKPPIKPGPASEVFRKPALTAAALRHPHALPPVAREATPELDDAAKARRAQEDEIYADELAIQQLEAEIAKLEAAQVQERGKAKSNDQDSMITRLLAANDASFASLPPTPTFDFDAAVADAAIPSALPLPVSNPLPQLCAFSALTFTKSLVTPLPPGLNRQHQIVGYAGAPIAALTFQVSLVVSAHEETVEELYCSVSQWARGELTPVIKECAGARDPKVLLWAISTYQPLALKRAKVWARLCWRYPGLLPQYAPGSKRISKKAKAKAKAHKPSPREINALLGERVLCFRPRSAGKGDKGKRSLEFVVRWSIGVDEVGEAVSTVDGDARVPGVWTQIDADGNLARVAPLFKDLVAERGVFEAVKCMVGLLFPHEEPRE